MGRSRRLGRGSRDAGEPRDTLVSLGGVTSDSDVVAELDPAVLHTLPGDAEPQEVSGVLVGVLHDRPNVGLGGEHFRCRVIVPRGLQVLHVRDVEDGHEPSELSHGRRRRVVRDLPTEHLICPRLGRGPYELSEQVRVELAENRILGDERDTCHPCLFRLGADGRVDAVTLHRGGGDVDRIAVFARCGVRRVDLVGDVGQNDLPVLGRHAVLRDQGHAVDTRGVSDEAPNVVRNSTDRPASRRGDQGPDREEEERQHHCNTGDYGPGSPVAKALHEENLPSVPKDIRTDGAFPNVYLVDVGGLNRHES